MLNIFKNQKPKRFLFVVVSDTHAGHLSGLINPNTEFVEYHPNGDIYKERPQLTETQKKLWSLYTSHKNEVAALADGDPIILLHNGDLTIGGKYPNQMSFTAISNQLIAAAENIRPWLDLPNVIAVRLTYGTQSHEFYEGTAPKLVVDRLQLQYPNRDIQLVKHGLIDIAGSTFDYAHHGPYPGSRKWLEGNVALFYLRDAMLSKLIAHQEPPHYYIRSHYHTPIEVHLSIRQNGMFSRSWLFITPSYQLMGDYAQQATQSKDSVTNGCLVLECLGNRLVGDPIWLMETSDIRTKERIEL